MFQFMKFIWIHGKFIWIQGEFMDASWGFHRLCKINIILLLLVVVISRCIVQYWGKQAWEGGKGSCCKTCYLFLYTLPCKYIVIAAFTYSDVLCSFLFSVNWMDDIKVGYFTTSTRIQIIEKCVLLCLCMALTVH